MKKHIITLTLLIISQYSIAQAVYGVFTPTPNIGEKQMGTVDPSTGDITLLGTSPVETGSLAMTTGATALNVTDNHSYFSSAFVLPSRQNRLTQNAFVALNI